MIITLHVPGKRRTLGPIEILAGKALRICLTPAGHVVVNDPHRTTHLQIERTGDSCEARNASAAHQACVNGVPLTVPVKLHDGDAIRIGDNEIRFSALEDVGKSIASSEGTPNSPSERHTEERLDSELQQEGDHLKTPLSSSNTATCRDCHTVLPCTEVLPAGTRGVSARGVCFRCLQPRQGDIVGGYRLGRLLATGRTGKVFEAEHLYMRARRALKVLDLKLTQHEGAWKRFRREAEAAGRTVHANIVRTFDAGEESGVCYIAMELLEGETLAQRLARIPRLDLVEGLGILVHLARGVRCLHEAEILHRDLRPANVWMASDGTAKIIDLGTAFLAEAASRSLSIRHPVPIAEAPYVAPERFENPLHTDYRSDLYSLGAMAFRMLVGVDPPTSFARTPRRGSSSLDVRTQPARGREPKRKSTSTSTQGRILRRLPETIPIALREAVGQLLNPIPKDRYSSAVDLLADLAALDVGASPGLRTKYDAFISYSSKDMTTAVRLWEDMETGGFRCWIAPRRVQAGRPYSEEILSGIEDSRILVLLLSKNSNASPHVHSEVERASSKCKPILTVRLEDVLPSRALELFTSKFHWIDAFRLRLETVVEEVASAVRCCPPDSASDVHAHDPSC